MKDKTAKEILLRAGQKEAVADNEDFVACKALVADVRGGKLGGVCARAAEGPPPPAVARRARPRPGDQAPPREDAAPSRAPSLAFVSERTVLEGNRILEPALRGAHQFAHPNVIPNHLLCSDMYNNSHLLPRGVPDPQVADPLLAPDDGHARVQRQIVRVAVRQHGIKEHRVAARWHDLQAATVRRLGKGRRPARVGQLDVQ